MRLTSAEAGEYLMSDKPCPDSSASQVFQLLTQRYKNIVFTKMKRLSKSLFWLKCY